MTRKSAATYGTLLVLGLAILPVGLKSAMADTITTATEQVTVANPYTIRRQLKATYVPGRGNLEAVSVSQTVSHADLDLSKPADVETFKERVVDAATANCRQLARHFPNSSFTPEPGTDNCVKNASRSGLARVDQLASRAQRRSLASADPSSAPAR